MTPAHGALSLSAPSRSVLGEVQRRQRARGAGDTRGGEVVLFTGPSGTGKTVAAQLLAEAAGAAVHRVDLNALRSRYIGETEKNIARLFDRAERAQAVLFFDEADALFGKRATVRDAHDKYANLETSYLRERIARYPALVILATRRPSGVDAAVQRRVRATIRF